jgi:PhoH-like ATPase
MKKTKKIFVLDTSVILYDHNSVKSFKKHDVAIPITVLEELDNFKKGNDIKNFEAREFIRFIDKVSGESTLHDWINLEGKDLGKLKIVMNENASVDAHKIFGERKADHSILNAALHLSENFPNVKVVLVTKDINLRIKAKSLNLTAEDYETGKVEHPEKLYTGKTILDKVNSSIIDLIYETGYTDAKKVIKAEPLRNHYYILKSGQKSVLCYYNPETLRLERVHKQSAFGISPRNAEQAFAMHAILNPEVKLVTIQGVAGTGKTLLSLAGALEQKRNFQQIHLARPIVPLSNKDIGYLPGDIKSKLNPYMEPLWDNLKFIKNQFAEKDKEQKNINEMIENEKIVITPLAYIRGRSLSNVFFIVDEAQNLTPHEVKTIISRAGDNTKIVFTGDIFQIDTPYLDTESNGLSYLIEKIKSQPIYAHITLEKGERSELANLANEFL